MAAVLASPERDGDRRASKGAQCSQTLILLFCRITSSFAKCPLVQIFPTSHYHSTRHPIPRPSHLHRPRSYPHRCPEHMSMQTSSQSTPRRRNSTAIAVRIVQTPAHQRPLLRHLLPQRQSQRPRRLHLQQVQTSQRTGRLTPRPKRCLRTRFPSNSSKSLCLRRQTKNDQAASPRAAPSVPVARVSTLHAVRRPRRASPDGLPVPTGIT